MNSPSNASTARILRRQVMLAHFRILHLRDLLRKAEVHEFPSESPTSLLHLMSMISDRLEGKLTIYQQQIERFVDDESFTNQYRRIWVVSRAGARLAAFVRYIDAATVENVPWGLVGQLRRLCEKIDPSLQIIVRPRWTFLHDHFPVKSMLKKATMGDPEIDSLLVMQPLYLILSFPRSERNNMLQHAVWGHEIAHVLQQILVSIQSATSEPIASVSSSDESTLSSNLAHRIQISPANLDLLVIQTQQDLLIDSAVATDYDLNEEMKSLLYKQVFETLYNWVTEITCDALGIRLFGPAMLFAFSEIAESLYDLNRSTDTHPAPALRMELMIDDLQELGYIGLQADNDKWNDYQNTLENEVSRIREVCYAYRLENEDNDRGALLRFRVIKEALDSSVLRTIRQEINAIQHECFLDVSALKKEVPILAQLLDQGIPPNKIELTPDDSVPASLAVIINAGWLCWLRYFEQYELGQNNSRSGAITEERDQRMSVADYRDRLDKLVLKAVESSEIQLQFQDWEAIHPPDLS